MTNGYQMKLDKNGLIIQNDGGDTAQRTGMWWSAVMIRHILGNDQYPLIPGLSGIATSCELLITTKGLIRNPIGFNNPKDTSRDQTRSMVIACGLYGLFGSLSKLRLNWGLYPNKDVSSPENWNEYRRAWGMRAFLLGDIWNLAGVILRCIVASRNPDDVGDDLNTLLTTVYFSLVYPTWISKLALRVYLKYRPTNYGVTKLGEIDPIMGALKWYFRPEMGGNGECAEIWRDIIAKLRSKIIK